MDPAKNRISSESEIRLLVSKTPRVRIVTLFRRAKHHHTGANRRKRNRTAKRGFTHVVTISAESTVVALILAGPAERTMEGSFTIRLGDGDAGSTSRSFHCKEGIDKRPWCGYQGKGARVNWVSGTTYVGRQVGCVFPAEWFPSHYRII